MQDFKYPYVTRKVNLPNGVKMAFVDEGQGDTTLLFIHGLGSYLPAWKKQVDSLRLHYRCVAVDLPNYGKSSQGDYSFSMAFFAESIEQFVAALELDNVVLVGHSMGGQIALTVALRHIVPLDGLILLAPAGIETFSEKEVAWLKQVTTPALVKAAPIEQIRKNFAANFYGAALPDDAQFMLDDRLLMRDMAAEYERYCQMIPKCVVGMLEGRVFERLGELTLPTLVVYGENDGLIPNKFLHPNLTSAQVGAEAKAAIPNSELLMLPSAGHFVQWDQPGAVNSAIDRFLRH